MSSFLQRILSVFFYFLFFGFFLLIFPFHALLLLRRVKWMHNASHRLNMAWGWVIMYPVGLWVSTKGRKKLYRKQKYIFAANHTSYLDIPICNVSILHSFRFIGKAELNRMPLFGYMFKRLHIPVNRGSVTDAFKSFKYARKKLEDGTSILIFPEATIPDKKLVTLKRFKDGAFRMAIETGTPLVPVTILGADIAMPDDGKLLIRPYRIRVIFHDPIETQGMEITAASQLRDQVYNTMFKTLVEEGYGRGDQRPDQS